MSRLLESVFLVDRANTVCTAHHGLEVAGSNLHDLALCLQVPGDELVDFVEHVRVAGASEFRTVGGMQLRALPAPHGQVVLMSQARDADQASDAFLAHMGHDIRTPLASIMTNLELIGDENLSERQRSLIAAACNSSRQQFRMLDNLLHIARLQSGQLEGRQDVFRVPALLHEQIQDMHQQALAKGLTLELNITHASRRAVRGHRKQLASIIESLLDNAITYTNHGGVWLRYDESLAGSLLRFTISISDTGPGLSEDDLEAFRHPFARPEIMTAHKPAGFGFGLLLARQFTLALDGSFSYLPAVGGGSCFTLEFAWPLAESLRLQKPHQKNASRKHLHADDGPSLKGRRVLIVEDDQALLYTMKVLLNDLGIVTSTAANGEDAIARFQSEQPEFVFMDINLPKMDGCEATRAIRKLDETDVPIVALTAIDDAETHRRCWSVGMVDVIMKPYNRQQIVDCLQRFLHRPEASAWCRQDKSEDSMDSRDIDFDRLQQTRELVGDDEQGLDLIRELVESLSQESQDVLNELHQAIGQRDAASLTSQAHRLKSRCGMLGLERSQRTAAEMEQAGREMEAGDGCDWQHMAALTDACGRRLKRGLDSLRIWLRQEQSTSRR